MTPRTTAARRPIRARESGWAVAGAGWLAGNGVSPNSISMAGMAFGIAAGTAFAATGWGAAPDRLLWVAGAVLIVLRLLANMFDGMVAVETDRATPAGELFNEIPDRISDLAIFVGLGYSSAGIPALGWAAACVAIFVAYVRVASASAGAPADFRGPMAKQQRMAIATLAAAFMAVAPTAWVVASGAGAPAAALAVVAIGGIATAGRRLARAYRVLTSKEY